MRRRCRPLLEAAVERVAARVAPVGEDRSLSDDVEQARDLIRSGALLDGIAVRS